MDDVRRAIEELKDSDRFVRNDAAKRLGELRDASAVPALVEALEDGDVNVRNRAAEALGEIGDASSAPALVRALVDDERIMSLWASWALMKIGKPAVPSIVKALDDKKNTRMKAIKALKEIQDASAVPHLIRLLEDRDADTRMKVIEAIGMIGDASVVPSLLGFLCGKDLDFRIKVIEAIGLIGDVSAVPSLLGLLEDDRLEVRQEASKALWNTVAKASGMDELREIEARLKEECGSTPDKKDRVRTMMHVAMLLGRISSRKNKMAAQDDILLDGKPKAPRKGSIYRSIDPKTRCYKGLKTL